MYPNGEPQVQSLVLIFFSSLKRQRTTFIIVRFKVVQDWHVKLHWCYFISHFGAWESFNRKSCTTTAINGEKKTVDEHIAWNALKWMLTAKVMLDIIPSPQGRLLLTRSVLCCLQGDSLQMTELHPTQNSKSSLSSMFYLAWFTHRFCVIIYFNDRWVGVGCFAGKTGEVELFSAKKKKKVS